MTAPATPPTTDPSRAKSRRMEVSAAACVGLVAAMLGLAFAAVPLYDLFCRMTGFGGTTQVARAAPSTVLDRRIEVRFDSNTAPGLGLAFKPEARSASVRLGETGLAFYTVTNTTDRPITAVATYNVTPHKTGVFFQKLECFCFEDRVFQPGETIELPVVFYVDPELASSRDTKEVQTITLSYTFFEAVGARRAAQAGGGGAARASAR